MFFSLAAVEVGDTFILEHCRLNSTWTGFISYMACNSYNSYNSCSWYLKLEQVPKGLQNFVEVSF